MSHYQVIVDHEKLEAFVEWLPDLEDGQVYYVELFCRKKYDSDMPNSKTYNLNRRIIEKKNQIVQSIQKFETPLGSYWLRDHEVSQESLALYINTNPRDLRKASYALMKSMLEKMESGNALRPQSMVMTEIHRAKAKSNFVTWDVDHKNDIDTAIKHATSIVGPEALSVIETRGGFHFLVEPKKANGFKGWHTALCNVLEYDQLGDIMSPIPGCVQGSTDFCPCFTVRRGTDFRVPESS